MIPEASVRIHRFSDGSTRYRNFLRHLHVDWPLLIGVLLLIIAGLFILYSASGQDTDMIRRQIIHFGIALPVMLLASRIPPHWWLHRALWLYLFGIVLLLAVLAVGHSAKGATRWLNVGGVHFQPAELVKLFVPMMLACYYSGRSLPPGYRDILINGVIILIPAALVLKQPDLGTAIIIVVSGGCVILFAGVRWRVVCAFLVALTLSLPILWHFLHPYQKQRVLTFLSPERDPLGSGYHIIQSKIAIGAGGLWGQGWLHGTQSHLQFLPENTTDFIFSVCAEEFGLLGAGLLILLYCLIVWRVLALAARANNHFARLLVAGIGLTFFLSAFVNIAMVSGILPVVGIPLPLVSYSGTSMVTWLLGFGIIMSIGRLRPTYF